MLKALLTCLYLVFLTLVGNKLAWAQSTPGQCRDAGGTIQTIGPQLRGQSVKVHCMCGSRAIDPLKSKCQNPSLHTASAPRATQSSSEGRVTSSECSRINGVPSSAVISGCACAARDEKSNFIVLDPRDASNYNQQKRKCEGAVSLAAAMQVQNGLDILKKKDEFCDGNPPVTSCPEHLKKFLRTDKDGWPVPFFKEDSPVKACEDLKPRRKRLTSAEAVEQFLQSEASSSVNRRTPVAHCIMSLDTPMATDQARSIHVAEYYYLMNRIKIATTKHLEEITAIDATLGNSKVMEGVNCYYPEFPQVQTACKNMQKNCQSNSSAITPLASATEKVEQKLAPVKAEVIGLEKKEARVTRSGTADGITPTERLRLQELRQHIKEVTKELPWMSGKQYQSAYQKDGNTQEAVKKQFEANRLQLLQRLQALRLATECLGADQNNKSKCKNFDDTIERYTEDVEFPADDKMSPQMRDIAAEFKRVKCHRDQRQDVKAAKRSSAITGGMIALTAIPAVISGGTAIPAIAAAVPRMAASRAVIAATAAGVAEAGGMVVDAADVKNSCSQRATHSLGNTNYQLSNKQGSACNQVLRYGEAVRDYGNCITSVAMASLGTALAAKSIISVASGAAKVLPANKVAASVPVAGRNPAASSRATVTTPPAASVPSASASKPVVITSGNKLIKIHPRFSLKDLDRDQLKGFETLPDELQDHLLSLDKSQVIGQWGTKLKNLGKCQ